MSYTVQAVPDVAIPHFAYPYTIQGSTAVVVEQDSLQEVTACVETIVNCQIGECPELPTFGIPDLTFQSAPPSPQAIVAAIQRWEPRANEATVVSALDNTGANWGMILTTQITGTGQ